MATIRKRGRKWQAQVRKAGSQPMSSSFPTRAAAERWSRRIEAEIDDGRARGGVAATGTLGELILRYRRELGGVTGLGRSTELGLRLLDRGLGTVRLRQLDTAAVLRYARQRRAEGAGPATLSNDLSLLGTVLRTARGLWQLGVSDAPVIEARAALRMARMVGRSRHRDRRPTREELLALFSYWRSRPRTELPMPDLVMFAIASCMRLGEICKIRRVDLDPVKRTVIVRARKDPRQARDAVVPLLDVTGYDALAIALRAPPGDDGRIWPYRPATITRAWQRACAACGIADLRFHDLRHEGVSRLFEAGLSIEQVALVSGHRSWANLKRYTQLQAASLTAAFPVRARPATE